MRYKYGEVIITTKHREDIINKISECIALGYKLGDEPAEKIPENVSYVLIVNSDNYIDVEYLVPAVEHTIISLAEYNLGAESGLIKGA